MDFNVGSCTYVDGCKDVLNDIANLTSINCPPELLPAGIDCNCPFKMVDSTQANPLVIDVPQAEIPDLSKTIVSFLASGDFEITLKGTDTKGYYGCVNLKLTIKQATTGK